jgi:hypothetical protein
MTLKEQIYKFSNLDIHASIAIQMSIETRRIAIVGMASGKEMNKETKAVIAEIDQMYDDLDRHIAALVREQEYQELAKKG